MKNVLITEYKYNVLIKDLPNNFSRDKTLKIAQRVLKNNISYAYTMSASTYEVNPRIIYNSIDYKLYKNHLNVIDIKDINFIVSYNDILIDERFKYIFK